MRWLVITLIVLNATLASAVDYSQYAAKVSSQDATEYTLTVYDKTDIALANPLGSFTILKITSVSSVLPMVRSGIETVIDEKEQSDGLAAALASPILYTSTMPVAVSTGAYSKMSTIGNTFNTEIKRYIKAKAIHSKAGLLTWLSERYTDLPSNTFLDTYFNTLVLEAGHPTAAEFFTAEKVRLQ